MSRVVGARTGVTLNIETVKKDGAGFDDLDEFWGAKEEKINSPSRRRSSVGTMRKSNVSGRESEASVLTTFDYDEGDTIYEEWEEETMPEIEDPLADDGAMDVEKSDGTPANIAIRKSKDRRRSTIDTFDGNLPFEDSPNAGGASPFDVQTSPIAGATSPGSSGKKGKGSPKKGASPSKRTSTSPGKNNESVDYGGDSGAYYDDDYGGGDDYGGMDDDMDMPGDHNSPRSRRVSFGSGTKSKSGGKSKADMRTPNTSNDSNATTPESGLSSAVSTPGSMEFARGIVQADESYIEDEEEEATFDDKGKKGKGRGKKGKKGKKGLDESMGNDTDSEEGDTTGFADDSFADKIAKNGKRKGAYYDDDDDMDQEDEEEEEEESEDEDGNRIRRSRRATKGQKLNWWKGERLVYAGGKMLGVLTAEPTPKKKSQGKKNRRALKGVSKRLDESSSDEDGETENKAVKKEDPIVLPKEVDFLGREDGDELAVWDDSSDTSKQLKVVCHEETLQPPSALPITTKRPSGKNKVGYAAQSFNIPEIPGAMSGWITGFVELPPSAIKDAEGVGECAQVFFISECQDGAVEFALADPKEPEWDDESAQRQLLKKGDTFFVPPGNIYRLENHSTSHSCMIFWTIVKPLTEAA